MRFIDLAKELIPEEVPYQEISLSILLKGKRLPVAAFWPQGNEKYKAGVVIPSIDVEDTIVYFNKSVPSDPLGILTIENLLKKELIIKHNEAMKPKDFAMFSILHEVGHWYDFQDRYVSKGLNGLDYLRDYQIEEEKLGLSRIGNRAKNEAKGSPAQLELLELYHQKYREISFEKNADIYALQSLKNTMK